MRVQSTRRRNPEEINYADIREIVLFSNLEELVFAEGVLIMSEYNSDLSYFTLRRLTMRGDKEIDDLGSTPTPIFTKDHTPELTHLALEETRLAYWGFMHHSSGETDQITTLVIKDLGIWEDFQLLYISANFATFDTSLSTSEVTSSQTYL